MVTSFLPLSIPRIACAFKTSVSALKAQLNVRLPAHESLCQRASRMHRWCRTDRRSRSMARGQISPLDNYRCSSCLTKIRSDIYQGENSEPSGHTLASLVGSNSHYSRGGKHKARGRELSYTGMRTCSACATNGNTVILIRGS